MQDPILEDPMPETDPALHGRRSDASTRSAWLPSRGALLAAAIAFVVGLLIFIALWLDQRNNNNFYRSLEAPRSIAGQVFDPLPVPLPAGADNASGLGQPGDIPVGGAEAPIRNTIPVGPPIAPAPPVAAPAAPTVVADRSTPQPVRSPAPRYPRDAQRRGQSGTVLLRVHVDRNGEPSGVDLVQSSGSRSLDRAAVDAVRRWRFDPAIANGQPIDGVVQVPITFNLGN